MEVEGSAQSRAFSITLDVPALRPYTAVSSHHSRVLIITRMSLPASQSDARRARLLAAVIREHVETAMPVGSEAIVEKYDLGVSSATVRNDMAALEEAGMLAQPHTSAGRVPTEPAYRWFAAQSMVGGRADAEALAARERRQLAAAADAAYEDDAVELARALAQLAGEAVFVSTAHGRYVAGMANLMAQPELGDRDAMLAVARALDGLDAAVAALRLRIGGGVTVLIGADSPFGGSLATVFTSAPRLDRGGIVGILGPSRMDYDMNVALMREVHKLFS